MTIDFYVMQGADTWDEGTWWDAGCMTEGEWDALFYGAFGCFMGINEPYIEGEPIGNWEERVKSKFQSAIPEYPLLGRMWDICGEYWYAPEESELLRAECIRAAAKVSDEGARVTLGKLARACEKAMSHKAGLKVAGD